ncbi:MAG: serine hydrolase domain-containing protein [Lysobacter sp.]
MNGYIKRAMCVAALFAAVLGPVAAADRPAQSLAEQLQQRSDRFFDHAQPGGVVLVRQGDAVLLRKAYGLADVENQVAMKPESVFRIASATKQFTAVAILQLIDGGKLKLDQPVGSVLPALPTAIAGVSIRQLPTHTSGIKNISSIAESRAARRNEATADELIAFFKDRPLDFASGSRFSYSNSNYILLSRVIEQISGASYADYLQRSIFVPMGMTQTRYGSHTALIVNRAQGYQQGDDGQLMNADFISMTQPQGAGGLVTTVDDLSKWDAALYGNQLVDPALLAQAFRKATLSDGSEQPYGFGWIVSQVQGQPSVEHSGFINGFNAYVLRVPKDKLFVAILTNAEFLSPDDLAVELAAMAMGRPYDKTAAVSTDHGQWLGRYDFGQDVLRDIVLVDGKLHSQRVGSDPIELKQSVDGRYYLGDGLDYVSFARRPEGGTAMTLHNRLMGDSVGVAAAKVPSAP